MARGHSLLAHASARPARSAWRDPGHALLAAEPEPDDACASYTPGHQMHYLHQGQAMRAASMKTRNVIVEGHRVIVVVDSAVQFDYQHHDPDRIRAVLGLFPTARRIYPRSHALSIGPYWFNCAPESFEPCRPGVQIAGS